MAHRMLSKKGNVTRVKLNVIVVISTSIMLRSVENQGESGNKDNKQIWLK